VRSATFDNWLGGLKDPQAVGRVLTRVRRLVDGNPGDVRPVGGGISELRINYGPGYRVYYAQRGGTLVLLLCGGDKATQNRDIKLARTIAEEWNGHGHEW